LKRLFKGALDKISKSYLQMIDTWYVR